MRALYLIVLLISLSSFKPHNGSCVGKWLSYESDGKQKKSVLELYKNNNKLYMKVLFFYPRKGKSENPICHACDGDKKNKPIVGMQLCTGLSWDGSVWGEGKVMDMETGKWYEVKIWLDPDNEDVAFIRGYLGVFYQTHKMYRYKD
jgi:uncharacterized protein (DUF2147 family)